MPTRYYSNAALPTQLAAACTAGATTITVGSFVGYPTSFPYIITVDKQVAGKGEAMLVTAASGSTLTVARGYDGTVAVAHDPGAVVSHDHTAVDYRETQERLDRLEGGADYAKVFLFGGS